jgi:ribosome-associated heat shock protein Hsp15
MVPGVRRQKTSEVIGAKTVPITSEAFVTRLTPGTSMADSVENRYDPRLDVWLDIACLFKTRSEAQRACKGGKIDLNGHSAKPHREIKIGDVIEITRALGRRQRVVVVGITGKHLPKSEARKLYEDTTPPPSPEEQVLLDLMRLAGPRRGGGQHLVTPDRRERRLRGAKVDGVV